MDTRVWSRSWPATAGWSEQQQRPLQSQRPLLILALSTPTAFWIAWSIAVEKQPAHGDPPETPYRRRWLPLQLDRSAWLLPVVLIPFLGRSQRHDAALADCRRPWRKSECRQAYCCLTDIALGVLSLVRVLVRDRHVPKDWCPASVALHPRGYRHCFRKVHGTCRNTRCSPHA